jgi:dCTP deaminase
MSTLSKIDIVKALQATGEDQLVVTPILSPKQVGDISIDLRLGNQFITFRGHAHGTINPFQLTDEGLRRIQRREIVRFKQKFILHPGSMVLGATFEYIKIPPFLEGQVEGRSSWARLGLQIATATCVEPGFCGVVTLELSNVGTMPLELFPGVRIAQLVLRRVEPRVANPYELDKKYRYAIGPQFSRLNEDKDALPFTRL